VETLANVAAIMEKGSEWFKGIGKGSSGTKIYLLKGKVAKSGFAEVPVGTTLRALIHDIGGGVKSIQGIKAIQVGGLFGGFVTASMLDRSLDFDAINEIAGNLYSNSITVLDKETCIVDYVNKQVFHLALESCGRCTPCRDGLVMVERLIKKITSGNGNESDIENLKSLANVIKATSLCGFGQSATNSILSAIENFHDEFVSHAVDKKCGCGTCKM
jgi:NADH-quinone oxidoreductase subunit F